MRSGLLLRLPFERRALQHTCELDTIIALPTLRDGETETRRGKDMSKVTQTFELR